MKVMILYRPPADPDAFMRHYEEVHLPLARKIPGVQRLEINRIAQANGAPYFLVTEVYYSDKQSMKAAMASPENKAAGADLANFADGGVEFMVAEVTQEVFA